MVRRAHVVEMSSRRYSAPDIADALDATSDWVRRVIHEFNDIGLEALVPAWSGGRPKSITDEMRARIIEVVDSRPKSSASPTPPGRSRTCAPICCAPEWSRRSRRSACG